MREQTVGWVLGPECLLLLVGFITYIDIIMGDGIIVSGTHLNISWEASKSSLVCLLLPVISTLGGF